MESVSLALQDYKEIVGTIAGLVRISQLFAGVFICKNIYKKGNTDGVSAMPFIGGCMIGTLMVQYSLMIKDTNVLKTNLGVIVLCSSYLSFYFYYSQTKRNVLKSLGYAAVFIAVITGYTRMENPELIQYRFGLILTVILFAVIGSPLLKLKQVIRNQDASVIPFPIVLCRTATASSWLLYGIIIMNKFMIFQNVVGFFLSGVQLALCFIYPGNPDKKKKSK